MQYKNPLSSVKRGDFCQGGRPYPKPFSPADQPAGRPKVKLKNIYLSMSYDALTIPGAGLQVKTSSKTVRPPGRWVVTDSSTKGDIENEKYR
jgi:hypothetical protein